MAILPVENGESGGSVRAKINAVIDTIQATINALTKFKNTDEVALQVNSDVTTTGVATRALRVVQENKVAGGKAYSALFSTEDKTNGAAYSHIVGVESGVWQPNAFPAGGSDLYGAVVGIKATAGTWPGAGHRIEFTDYANWPGQFAVGYATLDGVTPVAFEVGVNHQTNDGNSQQIRLYARDGGTRRQVGQIVGGRYGGLYLQSTNGNIVLDATGYGALSTTFYQLGSDTGPKWLSGAGTPEGAVSARVGSLYSRTDGSAGSTLYVKESGTGNTGWVAK